jgi:DNA-binding transcriptional ArsR family regulator
MADPKTPPLTESSRAVLRLLAAQGPITRPKLGAILELSKPTMSAAVSELSKAGLVTSFGSHKGATGRTAKIYGLGPAAGYVIGIDVGEAQVRAVAHSPGGDRGTHSQAEQGDGR